MSLAKLIIFLLQIAACATDSIAVDVIVEDVTAVTVEDATVIATATAFLTVPVKNVSMGVKLRVICAAAAANWILVTAVSVTVVDTQGSHAGTPSVLGLVGTSWEKIAARILTDIPGEGSMMLNLMRTWNQPALLKMML